MFVGGKCVYQDLTSKKGETMLPEAGDWAVQFDAAPFLNYAGNLFNAGATAPGADFVNAGAIAGSILKMHLPLIGEIEYWNGLHDG